MIESKIWANFLKNYQLGLKVPTKKIVLKNMHRDPRYWPKCVKEGGKVLFSKREKSLIFFTMINVDNEDVFQPIFLASVQKDSKQIFVMLW